MSVKKEIKSFILILLILAWGYFVFWLLSEGINQVNSNSTIFFGLYFLLYGLSLLGYKKRPNRFFKVSYTIVSIPLLVPLAIFFSAIGSISIISHVFLFIMTCLVSSLAVPLILIRIFEIPFEDEVVQFIGLTLGTTIAIVLYRPILKLVYYLAPFQYNRSEVLDKEFKNDATEYLLNKENIRLIIYSGYSIFLIINAIELFYNFEFIFTNEKDRAVYQSFICFLALDKALIYSQGIKFRPSILLEKLVGPFRLDRKTKKKR